MPSRTKTTAKRARTADESRPEVKPKKVKRAGTPRTASGKKANPELLAAAQQEAQRGNRERTEEGHIAAGRVPPSQGVEKRVSGASARVIDEAIRDYRPPITEDEKLLSGPATGDRRATDDFTRTDTWRAMRIMSEVIEGFDTLAGVQKGVSVFGSARTHPDDPQYAQSTEV